MFNGNAGSGLTRRRAIGALAWAGAASTAANSAVTVGLLGCGDRGLLVSRFLTKNANARIVALCDLFDDRIERARHELGLASPAIFQDYRELLRSDVDAVIVATPVFLHPEHFEAVLQAGKHTYMEKPAAPDVAGCKRILRAASSAPSHLNVAFGFQARYGPGYRKAKKLLDAGGIGPVRMVHTHFIKGDITGAEPLVPRPLTDREKARNWKPWRDLNGDIIVETYCHNIDVVNWFLNGHPLSALGSGGRTLRRNGDLMDHVNVTFTYGNRVQAAVTGCQITAPFHRSQIEDFYGAEGTIQTSRQYWTYSRSQSQVETETIPGDITKFAIDEFIDRIRNASPENTAARSAESTLTAIMGRMAIDGKREVSWEEMMASE